METSFIVIVVLSLIADSRVCADSAGVQCVYKCLNPDSEGTSVARSALKEVVHRASASEGRQCTGAIIKFMICVEECQVDKYTIPARKVRRISEHYCNSVDQPTREKYLAENDQFNEVFLSEWDKCLENEDEPDTPEESCTLASDCVFGSALTIARNGISDDVVTVNVIFTKLNYAAYVETRYGESLPKSCEPLFKPTVPEPPYQPEPYPYEPYPYEPYQSEHYPRNPYQNPYQSNPYQRNPYQRNPYQRNPYRRNPYKRRN